MNPVESIHYIFDRYAYLNAIMEAEDYKEDVEIEDPEKPGQKQIVKQPLQLHPDSTADTIRKVIRLARALNHPDHAKGQKKKREAEAITSVIDDCERMLTNVDLKPHYDEKLADFKKNNPRLVSASGMPIIDLGSEQLDVESLLSDSIVDTQEFEDRVKAMVQYDEKNFIQTKALFDSMSDNAQIKSIYRDALTKKLTYLTLLEDAAWLKVGVMNRKSKIDGHLMSGDDYAAKVEEALKNVADMKIEQGLNQRGDAARIGMGSLPLLLTFNDASAPAGQNAEPAAPSTALVDPAQMAEILVKLKTKARENFEIRADYVRDIARQKQTVLEELVSIAPMTALNDHDPSSSRYDFYLVNPGADGQVLLRLELDVRTGNATIGEIYQDEFFASTLQAAQLPINSFLVERNSEISDFLIEVSGAADRVFKKYKEQFAQAHPGKPEAPQP